MQLKHAQFWGEQGSIKTANVKEVLAGFNQQALRGDLAPAARPVQASTSAGLVFESHQESPWLAWPS